MRFNLDPTLISGWGAQSIGLSLTPPTAPNSDPSPTAGMNIAQRILHVGGRNNAAGYVEFGSTQAVEALVRQVLRDVNTPLPASAKREQLAAQPEAIEPLLQGLRKISRYNPQISYDIAIVVKVAQLALRDYWKARNA